MLKLNTEGILRQIPQTDDYATLPIYGVVSGMELVSVKNNKKALENLILGKLTVAYVEGVNKIRAMGVAANNSSTSEDVVKQVLVKCKKYVAMVHHTVEARHDDIDGDCYMDSGQYDIMKETKTLLDRIDSLVKDVE